MSYKFDTAKMIQYTHFFESVLFHKTKGRGWSTYQMTMGHKFSKLIDERAQIWRGEPSSKDLKCIEYTSMLV